MQSRLNVWDYVRRLREQGMTIVMTTNYLDEADQLCDRIAIIDGGKIRATGSPKDLKAGLGGDGVFTHLGRCTDPTLRDKLAEEIKKLSFIRSIRSHPQGVGHVRVDAPEKAFPALFEATNRIGCRLEGVEYHRPRLDDVFINYTGRSFADASSFSESEAAG